MGGGMWHTIARLSAHECAPPALPRPRDRAPDGTAGRSGSGARGRRSSDRTMVSFPTWGREGGTIPQRRHNVRSELRVVQGVRPPDPVPRQEGAKSGELRLDVCEDSDEDGGRTSSSRTETSVTRLCG
jgi:hypothetical protein